MKNLTVMQKKMIKYIAVVVVLLILLFVVLFIIKAFRGETLSYEKIENKMLSAAKSYYETNPHLLADEDIGYKSIDVKTLSEDGYMKNLNKMNQVLREDLCFL